MASCRKDNIKWVTKTQKKAGAIDGSVVKAHDANQDRKPEFKAQNPQSEEGKWLLASTCIPTLLKMLISLKEKGKSSGLSFT